MMRFMLKSESTYLAAGVRPETAVTAKMYGTRFLRAQFLLRTAARPSGGGQSACGTRLGARLAGQPTNRTAAGFVEHFRIVSRTPHPPTIERTRYIRRFICAPEEAKLNELGRDEPVVGRAEVHKQQSW